MMNDNFYQPIADYTYSLRTFGHGFTGSGHPVATAVALENIKIIQDENLVAHAAEVGQLLLSGLNKFSDHPLVGEVRGCGLIAAVEFVADKAIKAPLRNTTGLIGSYLTQRTQANGMINRAIGDSIAFCPPLISTKQQINDMIFKFEASLDETSAWVGDQAE